MPRDDHLPHHAGPSGGAPPGAPLESPATEAWRLAFGGMPVEDGLRLREAAQPRHFEAPDRGRYRGLLSVADLDALLLTDGGRFPRVTMADASQQGSAGVAEDRFTREDGRVIPDKLHACFDTGCTLVVSQLHELHPPLARFCRGLEKVFLHAVQCNVYLTPPGAQGFHAHYDTHDVLVLQVQGSKQWRVWPGQPVPHPSRRTRWDRKQATPDVEPLRPLMQPGDALYIPRGVMHDAATQEAGEPSLHLTVGFLEPTWADALRLAVDAMELEDSALREHFPTWRMGEPDTMEALGSAAYARLSKLATLPVLERLSVELLDRLARDQLVHSARTLAAQAPGPHDRLRLPEMMHHHLAANPDGSFVLRWAGDPVPVGEDELGWLEALGDGATAAELGGGPADDAALAFVRKLHRLGLLERA